jgi:hypothetical protein
VLLPDEGSAISLLVAFFPAELFADSRLVLRVAVKLLNYAATFFGFVIHGSMIPPTVKEHANRASAHLGGGLLIPMAMTVVSPSPERVAAT